MQFEQRTFANIAELLTAARASLAEGLFVRVGHDQEELSLAWLDRLAAQRSDWHKPIGEVLVAVAALPDQDAQSAVVDWFDTAKTAPALVGYGQRILRASPDLASRTDRSFDPPGDALPFSAVLPRLLEAAARYSHRDQVILFRRPDYALATLSTREDLLREAQVAIAFGNSRIDGGIDGWYTLDWLRQMAFFVKWIRAEVPAVLRDLAAPEDAAARQAVVEYALHAGDKADLEPLLQDWLRQPPPWLEQPATIKRLLAEQATLGACLRHALQAARAERESRPVPPSP